MVWVMSTIGTTNTPSFVKIREVALQFLSDLTWNDPSTILLHVVHTSHKIVLSMCMEMKKFHKLGRRKIVYLNK